MSCPVDPPPSVEAEALLSVVCTNTAPVSRIASAAADATAAIVDESSVSANSLVVWIFTGMSTTDTPPVGVCTAIGIVADDTDSITLAPIAAAAATAGDGPGIAAAAPTESAAAAAATWPAGCPELARAAVRPPTSGAPV